MKNPWERGRLVRIERDSAKILAVIKLRSDEANNGAYAPLADYPHCNEKKPRFDEKRGEILFGDCE